MLFQFRHLEDACSTETWLHEYLWSIHMWYNSVVQRTQATPQLKCTQVPPPFSRFFLVTGNDDDPQRLYGSFEFHSRGMQGKSYKCRSRLTREEHICRHNFVLKFSSKCAAFLCLRTFLDVCSECRIVKLHCQNWHPNIISCHFQILDPIFFVANFLPWPGKFARTKFRLHPIWWGLRLRCFVAWNILPYHRHGWVWW